MTLCPDEILLWANLALVCKECNTNKSDHYNPTEPLINPFVDDPASHLMFVGPLIFAAIGDAKGLRTVLQIKLDRMDLLERWARTLKSLIPLLEQWNGHPDGATKDLLKGVILDAATDSAEFAATVRVFLQDKLGRTMENRN